MMTALLKNESEATSGDLVVGKPVWFTNPDFDDMWYYGFRYQVCAHIRRVRLSPSAKFSYTVYVPIPTDTDSYSICGTWPSTLKKAKKWVEETWQPPHPRRFDHAYVPITTPGKIGWSDE